MRKIIPTLKYGLALVQRVESVSGYRLSSNHNSAGDR